MFYQKFWRKDRLETKYNDYSDLLKLVFLLKAYEMLILKEKNKFFLQKTFQISEFQSLAFLTIFELVAYIHFLTCIWNLSAEIASSKSYSTWRDDQYKNESNEYFQALDVAIISLRSGMISNKGSKNGCEACLNGFSFIFLTAKALFVLNSILKSSLSSGDSKR